MAQTISVVGIDSTTLVFHVVDRDDAGHVVLRKRLARSELAICEAVTRPTTRFVPNKRAEPQAPQGLHLVRARPIKARTALVSESRGLLNNQEYHAHVTA
jgi:transposase